MKCIAPLIISVVLLLVACGGSQTTTSAPASDLEQPTTATDPMVAACEAGTAKSCLVAADAREQAGDSAAAGELYRKACDLGESAGCAFAGGAWAEAGDLESATEAFAAGCEAGEPTSCYGLGLVKMGIYGGTADGAAAASAFDRGCAAGLADACAALADLVEAGEGVDQNAERATALREQACGSGAPTACTRLGLEALKAEDETAAREWFGKSCGGDVVDPDGCGWNGWVVYAGIGGAPDKGLGTATLRAACEAESAVGCAFAGAVAEREGNPEAGKALLAKACEMDAEQCEALTEQYGAFVKAK